MDTIKINKGNALMVAHRGLSGLERENTASAFVAAGNRSYFGMETDVRVTADGNFILLHDNDTVRCGGDYLIPEQSTLQTIQSILNCPSFRRSTRLNQQHVYHFLLFIFLSPVIHDSRRPTADGQILFTGPASASSSLRCPCPCRRGQRG